MTDSQAVQPSIVIVLGMHRSGTSLCAHILSALGFDMADEAHPNEGNARGHWERWEIVGFHDRILALFDRSWISPTHAHALPPGWWADPRVHSIRHEMVDWLRSKIAVSRHFGFKDPRTIRFLPLWREICADLGVQAQFVMCVRHPALVARSLSVRGDVIDPRDSELRWAVYNSWGIADLGLRPICILLYEDWFSDKMLNLHRLVDFLDRKGGMEDTILRRIATDIVAPQLRHHVLQSDVEGAAMPSQMYKLLAVSANKGCFSPELRDLAEKYCDFEQLVRPIQELASLVQPLQLALGERDVQLADGSVREAELRATSVAERQQTVTLAATIDELRADLAAARAREAEIHGALDAERQRAGVLQTNVANALIVEADLKQAITRQLGHLEATAATANDAEARVTVLENDLRTTRAELAQTDATVIELRAQRRSLEAAQTGIKELLARQTNARLSAEDTIARLQDEKSAFERDGLSWHAFVDRILERHVFHAKRPTFWNRRVIARARRYARRRQFAVAEQLYRKVLITNPHLLPVWLQYGHMVKNQGDLRAASRAYGKAVELDPSNADALTHYNDALVRLGAGNDTGSPLA